MITVHVYNHIDYSRSFTHTNGIVACLQAMVALGSECNSGGWFILRDPA